MKVTQLVQPAKEKRIKIPAEHTTVTRTEKVSDEQLEWQQVLCEINATPSAISQLQTALRKSGHYDGPIDGVIGPRTMRAVNAYAEERYIPVGDNYVPMAVVKELKLTL